MWWITKIVGQIPPLLVSVSLRNYQAYLGQLGAALNLKTLSVFIFINERKLLSNFKPIYQLIITD